MQDMSVTEVPFLKAPEQGLSRARGQLAESSDGSGQGIHDSRSVLSCQRSTAR